jgi:hypothetical protein
MTDEAKGTGSTLCCNCSGRRKKAALGNRDLGRRFRYEYAVKKGRPAKRPKTVKCRWCGCKIVVKPKGRLPLYHNQACRQRAYEQEKFGRPHLVRLRQDLGSAAIRAAVQQEALAILKELARKVGLPENWSPPPRPERKRPALRLVKEKPD